MPKIFLFRHAETLDNKGRIFSGTRDVVLTEEGIRQSEDLLDLLASEDIGISFSSPLVRARQTIEIVLKAHRKTKICIDPRIIERSYGYFQGRNKETLARLSMLIFKKIHRGYWIAPPGGESLRSVEKRVTPFLNDLVNTVVMKDCSAAICAHGNSMRALRIFFEKRPHSDFNKIESSVGQLFIYSVNDSDFQRLSLL